MRWPLQIQATILTIATALIPAIAAAGNAELEILRDQVYVEHPSGPLRGNLYLPAAKGPVPGIVMIHGGGWRNGDIDDMRRFAERAAREGLAVFNITYRLAPEHKFPAQLEDVRAAVRWLRGNAGRLSIDPQRIGAWGYSAGAHLAMLLGTVDGDALADAGPGAPSPRVATVVAGAAPTDLRRYPDNTYVADLMPEDANEQLFALASPVAMVTPDDAPMFLYHGKRDWIVDYDNSVNMHHALRDAGVPARLHTMALGHVVGYLFGGGAVDAGIEFLRRHL